MIFLIDKWLLSCSLFISRKIYRKYDTISYLQKIPAAMFFSFAIFHFRFSYSVAKCQYALGKLPSRLTTTTLFSLKLPFLYFTGKISSEQPAFSISPFINGFPIHLFHQFYYMFIYKLPSGQITPKINYPQLVKITRKRVNTPNWQRCK